MLLSLVDVEAGVGEVSSCHGENEKVILRREGGQERGGLQLLVRGG